MNKSDFQAVGEFHKKFDLPTSADGIPRTIDPQTRDFRLRFLMEEMEELFEGYGLQLEWNVHSSSLAGNKKPQDLQQVADALVDLVYVALGTAHLHRLPWPDLFHEVQRANMSKERCGIDHVFEPAIPEAESCDHMGGDDQRCGKSQVEHSVRGSALDVIKPKGFRPPQIGNVLMMAGWPGPELPGEDWK
jgi:predicted HAD superfamily Cof-like phosphohydrolase